LIEAIAGSSDLVDRFERTRWLVRDRRSPRIVDAIEVLDHHDGPGIVRQHIAMPRDEVPVERRHRTGLALDAELVDRVHVA
jgi:hypothetical protein